jgi:hypothetical protein
MIPGCGVVEDDVERQSAGGCRTDRVESEAANTPPFGFSLNTEGCRKLTGWPSYHPGSMRNWPPLPADAEAAGKADATRATPATARVRIR